MSHPHPAHTHPHHADHEHGKPLIRFDHASFWYPHGPALEDITLEIADGEFVGVIGPNGSGKTTLLRAILGLMPPTRGSLRIFDCACQNLRCYHRARIGSTTQHTVLDLIQRLHEELHLTIVLVSHDINLIAPLAERLALLKTRLYALGSAKQVLTKEILAQVYGPQILTTDTGHVIVADHHHN